MSHQHGTHRHMPMQELFRNLNGDHLDMRLRAQQHMTDLDVQPQSWFGSCRIDGDGFHTLQSNRNWTLTQTDRGSFTVHVSADSGFMINISPITTDLMSYIIILNDTNSESYIVKKHDVYKRIASRNDYRMADYHTGTKLQVSYNYGRIVVKDLTQGIAVFDVSDAQATPGMLQVGFGKMNSSETHPFFVKDVQFIGINPHPLGDAHLNHHDTLFMHPPIFPEQV